MIIFSKHSFTFLVEIKYLTNQFCLKSPHKFIVDLLAATIIEYIKHPARPNPAGRCFKFIKFGFQNFPLTSSVIRSAATVPVKSLKGIGSVYDSVKFKYFHDRTSLGACSTSKNILLRFLLKSNI